MCVCCAHIFHASVQRRVEIVLSTFNHTFFWVNNFNSTTEEFNRLSENANQVHARVSENERKRRTRSTNEKRRREQESEKKINWGILRAHESNRF